MKAGNLLERLELGGQKKNGRKNKRSMLRLTEKLSYDLTREGEIVRERER